MLLDHSTSQYADIIINSSKDVAITTTVLVATVLVAKYVKKRIVIPLLEKYLSPNEPDSSSGTKRVSDNKTPLGSDTILNDPAQTNGNEDSQIGSSLTQNPIESEHTTEEKDDIAQELQSRSKADNSASTPVVSSVTPITNLKDSSVSKKAKTNSKLTNKESNDTEYEISSQDGSMNQDSAMSSSDEEPSDDDHSTEGRLSGQASNNNADYTQTVPEVYSDYKGVDEEVSGLEKLVSDYQHFGEKDNSSDNNNADYKQTMPEAQSDDKGFDEQVTNDDNNYEQGIHLNFLKALYYNHIDYKDVDEQDNSLDQSVTIEHRNHIPFNMLALRSAYHDLRINYDFENNPVNYAKWHVSKVSGIPPEEVSKKFLELKENIETFIDLLDKYQNSITLIKSQQQTYMTTVKRLEDLIRMNPDLINRITFPKDSKFSLKRIKKLNVDYSGISNWAINSKANKEDQEELKSLITYTINYEEPQNKILCYIDVVTDITQVMKIDEEEVRNKIVNAYKDLIKSYHGYKRTLDGYNEQIEEINRKLSEELTTVTSDMCNGIVYCRLQTGGNKKNYKESSITGRFMISEDEEAVVPNSPASVSDASYYFGGSIALFKNIYDKVSTFKTYI